MAHSSVHTVIGMDLRRVKAIFYLPLGSKDRVDYVCDSIEAIYHHSQVRPVVILLDDSGTAQLGNEIKSIHTDVVVFPSEARWQGKGLSGRHAYETARLHNFAVENYVFDVIVRLDTDALITGDNIEDDFIDVFNAHPQIGVLGRHWFNSLGYRIHRGAGESFIRRLNLLPYRIVMFRQVGALNRIVKRAEQNGYIPGELVIGCVTAYSYECAFRISAFHSHFKHLRGLRGIAEDYLTTMFVKYVNMELGEAEEGSGPLAVQLRGITFSPAETIERGKKAIHSIKNDEQYTQDEIRTYFANFRAARTAENSRYGADKRPFALFRKPTSGVADLR